MKNIINIIINLFKSKIDKLEIPPLKILNNFHVENDTDKTKWFCIYSQFNYGKHIKIEPNQTIKVETAVNYVSEYFIYYLTDNHEIVPITNTVHFFECGEMEEIYLNKISEMIQDSYIKKY